MPRMSIFWSKTKESLFLSRVLSDLEVSIKPECEGITSSFTNLVEVAKCCSDWG